MENSRHEKVLLIVLGYTIGLITAYIYFVGSSDDNYSHTEVVYQQKNAHNEQNSYIKTHQPDAGVAIKNNEMQREPMESEMLDEGMGPTVSVANNKSFYSEYNHGELRLVTPQQAQLVSAFVSESLEELDQNEPGLHNELPLHIISPDGRFLYFCENDANSDGCKHYIYQVETNMIHYVKSNEADMVLDYTDIHWQNDLLVTRDYISVNSEEPWLLITK